MLLLHTSDWHIGRSFHGTGLIESQHAVLDQLTATVRERGVDAVLLAGDVYDRALPPADAVRLLDETLAAIRAAGAQVVITSGNHDSAVRLGFGGALMAASGVHLRTDPDRLAEPVLLEGRDGERAAVYGIPYLEPRHLGQAWGVDPHHTPVMREAVRRVREDLAARRADPDAGPLASIVLAHLFAAGGAGTEGERDIGEGEHLDCGGRDPEALVGTLGQVPVSVFDGLDYVALGHLHGRQTMAPHVRYSGSPLPYSFGEWRQDKGGWLVHVAAGEVTRVEEVDWPGGRRLAVLSGPIAELLDSAEHAWAEDRWVQVTVTDEERPEKALERLRSRFPHVLVFRHEPAGGRRPRERTYAQALREAPSDLALTTGFVHHVRERAATAEESALLDAALTAAREQEVRA
ncbi:exonuclease SbcCD subunit D [Micrococcus sp.]|uniref:exonuclease SbcCD subunit D n=1 Tax=Micrococcus sp. TaxID=1271 RepID=UPI0026DA8A5B|nr:exonuclease SbcCD subunit D [Micrococcus sp.]MDO4240259.1 exonuclease SbcCD subunit D [Micrococcus sp.]